MEEMDEDMFRPYPMTPSQGTVTGLCLVFNNVDFSVPHLAPRIGSVQDYQRIEKVFSCYGFLVEEKRNFTAGGMMDCLRRTAQRYGRHYCAFVCFFLSHGREDKICDCDGRLVPLTELIDMFVNHCPKHMAHKPKLFFVQICRDSEEEAAATSASPESPADCHKTAGIPIFPNHLHILLGFATTSGRQAYRSFSHGSPYIEKLTLVLRERGHKDSLYDLLKVTRQLVEVEVAVWNKDMCPCYITTLARPLTFNLLRLDLRHSLIQGLALGAMRIVKLLLFAQSLSNSLHPPPQVQGKPREQVMKREHPEWPALA